jgi:hypothetical protein
MLLADQEVIMTKERKRLRVTDSRITLEQLGFEACQNGNHLYNLIMHKKAKIINI